MEPQDYDAFEPEWGEWWKRTDELLDSINYWATGTHDEPNFNRIVQELREHINGMPSCPEPAGAEG
jgi:hypothetical protein